MTAPLEFWFEFASTYSYPAAMRVAGVAAAAGVPVRWRVFLLGPIFAAQGWTDSPFNIYPVKGRYMWRDMERICRAAGLPLRRPSQFPRNSLLAARVACAGGAAEWVPAFVRGVYHANFAEDRDIADAAVLADVLTTVGQAPTPILAAAQSPEGKARLRAQCDEAVRRGLCGAPSFSVGDEVFWGNDRLEEAVAWHRRHGNEADDIEAVLGFWFGAPELSDGDREAHQQRWFGVDAAFDTECRDRFAGLVGSALHGELDHWQETPRGRLALIVLLDQLPRNIFRGSAAAFLGDRTAAAVTLTGIDIRADRALDPVARAVFYLPLQHAEDPLLQALSMAMMERLVAEAPGAQRAGLEEWVAFARDHRDVIARFGRFPHRNACLGRRSTAAERTYLGGNAPRFGQ